MIWKGLPLIIFGNNGISKEVYCLIKDINRISNQQIFDFKGFIGADDSDVGISIIDNYKIISSDQDVANFSCKYPLIGMVIPLGTPKLKSIIYNKVKSFPNAVFPNIIHPSAIFDKENVELGEGNVITAGSILTCDVKIGNFNLINLNTSVGHDTEVGNFNVINPLVAISGDIKIMDYCLIGTGAQILQGLTINSYAKIGAGAVVSNDVLANTTVVGIPARPVNP